MVVTTLLGGGHWYDDRASKETCAQCLDWRGFIRRGSPSLFDFGDAAAYGNGQQRRSGRARCLRCGRRDRWSRLWSIPFQPDLRLGGAASLFIAEHCPMGIGTFRRHNSSSSFHLLFRARSARYNCISQVAQDEWLSCVSVARRPPVSLERQMSSYSDYETNEQCARESADPIWLLSRIVGEHWGNVPE